MWRVYIKKKVSFYDSGNNTVGLGKLGLNIPPTLPKPNTGDFIATDACEYGRLDMGV